MTLKQIADKYATISFDSDNYSIGGGLDGAKFASNRHEAALTDPGKLTLGKATEMFRKATGMESYEAKEVIKYAVTNMEWHHAGKLPKQYGGGMKKTYFLNASEIVMLAERWDATIDRMRIERANEAKERVEAGNRAERQRKFLEEHAEAFERQPNAMLLKYPAIYVTGEEMLGKYGWFRSECKGYNLTRYYTGWGFAEERLLHIFKSI